MLNSECSQSQLMSHPRENFLLCRYYNINKSLTTAAGFILFVAVSHLIQITNFYFRNQLYELVYEPELF